MTLDGFGAEAGAGVGAGAGSSNGEAARHHPKRWQVSGREERRRTTLQRQQQARRNHTDRLRMLVVEAMQKAEDEGEEEEQQGQQQQEQQPSVAAAAAASMEEAGAAAGADDGMAVEEPAGMAVDQQPDQHRSNEGPAGVVVTARRRGGLQRQPAVDLQRAQFFASQFSIPETLDDEIPSDLAGGWFVMPRAEGIRCLLVASSGGQTVSRKVNGDLLHRWESALPPGSILDCIYANGTYHVADLLVWNSFELVSCPADLRLCFFKAKFQEDLEMKGAGAFTDAGAADLWAHRILPLPYFDADNEGLRRAFSLYTPFRMDALLLIHKQGLYEFGAHPLALLAATSRFQDLLRAVEGESELES